MIKRLMKSIKRRRNPIAFWRAQGTKIGKNCDIHPSASLGSEPYLISIGDHVRISGDVRIFSHDGGLWVVRAICEELKNADKFGRVVIGNNVHLGANSVVMPGVHIGNNCIIGVGAIVTKDIPDNSVAVGVPARVIETVDEYIEKNKDVLVSTKNMSYSEKKEYVLSRLG